MPPGGPGGMAPGGGPPPAMGSPTLANIPPGSPSGPPMGGDPQSQGGALPRLVFQIEQSIQTLARALPPDASEKLDAVTQQIREVVAMALSGGGPTAENPTAEGGPY